MADSTSDARPSLLQRASQNTLLLLIVLCGVQFVDAFDVSSMGPALPEIGRDLGISPDTLQWVVTGYVLGYGGFLLLGGRLADLFDARRLLLGALAIFIVASVIGGLAQSGELLIGARIAKGITAAFTAPAALALLLRMYSDEGERHKALGAYLTVSSVGFTAGLVLGGILAAGTWRLVMLVPAGFALLLLIAGALLIPKSPPAIGARDRVDLVGAVSVTTGLLALVYGVSRTASEGWGDGLTIAALVVAVGLLATFVLVERARRAPLVPLGIFAKPGVARGNATIFLLQGAYVGWQFIATLYLQEVNDWTPVEVGLVFAPGGLFVLFTANLWARLAAQHGPW
ncbi:MAG: MFS transporter, partial [Actinomycetota bacterium]|nr:MFS transporter [Actinomycetota bacterium]